MVKRKIRSSSLMVLFIIGFIGYIIFNAWSMDNKSYGDISVDQFEKLMDQKDFTLINVHIPYQGEIDNTDILIPFNSMDQNKDILPHNKDAKIVVYCMGDHMSYIASEELIKMGYTRVSRLKGGMLAWQKKGGQLVHRQSPSIGAF
ncbi:MAG TPA: rhodanese-like domain-containing protein [Desulfobacterales bacterium]|nr:rhodanese-like domain-containing protein [Desulfobacterales bacterium]